LRSFGEQSPLFSKVFPKKNATLISRTRDTPNLIEKCSSSTGGSRRSRCESRGFALAPASSIPAQTGGCADSPAAVRLVRPIGDLLFGVDEARRRLPGSRIELRIMARRSSSSGKYRKRSSRTRNCASSTAPVTSSRLASDEWHRRDIVKHGHRSCDSRTASSLAICRSMEVVTHTSQKVAGSGLTQPPIRGRANGGRCNDPSSPRRCDRDCQIANSTSARWSIAHRYAKIVPWMIDRHIV
jgi:hypothetical protein